MTRPFCDQTINSQNGSDYLLTRRFGYKQQLADHARDAMRSALCALLSAPCARDELEFDRAAGNTFDKSPGGKDKEQQQR